MIHMPTEWHVKQGVYMAKKIHDRPKKGDPKPKTKEMPARERKKPEIERPDGGDEYDSYRDAPGGNDFEEYS